MGCLTSLGWGARQACTLCPVKEERSRSDHLGLVMGLMRLTTGPIRSSSEGLVGTFELGAVAVRVETEGESATTLGVGRGAAAGAGGAAGTVGLGASQASSGARAAAALPTAVGWTARLDESGAAGVTVEGRGAGGTVGLGSAGAAALRIAVMS